LPFVGDQESILGAVERFVGELHDTPRTTRVLATCLFIRAEGEGERLSKLDDEARREIAWFHGRKFAHVTDALVATFDGPARAIRCACAIRDAAQRAGVRLAAGLHTGECDSDGEAMTGTTVEIGALLAEAAAKGAAFGDQLRPGSAMDRAVHTSPAEERVLRRVDDGVDGELGDVALNDLEHFQFIPRVARDHRSEPVVPMIPRYARDKLRTI